MNKANEQYVYRARISIMRTGEYTSPEFALKALEEAIDRHSFEVEPETVIIERAIWEEVHL